MNQTERNLMALLAFAVALTSLALVVHLCKCAAHSDRIVNAAPTTDKNGGNCQCPELPKR